MTAVRRQNDTAVQCTYYFQVLVRIMVVPPVTFIPLVTLAPSIKFARSINAFTIVDISSYFILNSYSLDLDINQSLALIACLAMAFLTDSLLGTVIVQGGADFFFFSRFLHVC